MLAGSDHWYLNYAQTAENRKVETIDISSLFIVLIYGSYNSTFTNVTDNERIFVQLTFYYVYDKINGTVWSTTLLFLLLIDITEITKHRTRDIPWKREDNCIV